MTDNYHTFWSNPEEYECQRASTGYRWRLRCRTVKDQLSSGWNGFSQTVVWIMQKKFDLWKELKSTALKSDRSETMDDKYTKVIGKVRIFSPRTTCNDDSDEHISIFIQMERLMREKDSCKHDHDWRVNLDIIEFDKEDQVLLQEKTLNTSRNQFDRSTIDKALISLRYKFIDHIASYLKVCPPGKSSCAAQHEIAGSI